MKTQNPRGVPAKKSGFLHFLYLVSLSLILFSCYSKNKPEKSTAIQTIKPEKAVVVDLQPLGEVPESHIQYLEKELGKVYGNIRVNKPIPLPSSAWYNPGKRYRADSLIRFLAAITPDGHVTVGLTTRDISHTKGDIEDWGIMGLGYQPGPSCVVSTKRLDKKNLMPQYFKVAIHEIGHTQGLPHCPEKTCYMRDAEGKNRTNEETGFCESCRSVLESKGWTLSRAG